MKQVFIVADVPLNEAQYKRMKSQLDKQWKKSHPNCLRPILLEGGVRVSVEDLS